MPRSTRTKRRRKNSDAEVLSVVMPAYNEVSTLATAVERVLAEECVKELIITDDGSQDGTAEVLRSLRESDPRIKACFHERNRGKGAALHTAFAEVTGRFVVIQDADLEYTPREYPRLLSPLLLGEADAVIGSRFLGYGEHRVLYFWHSVGNKFLTLLSNMMTNLNLTDMECGQKMFRAEILQSLRIEERRFGVEPEIVAKLSALKARIYEVPVSYYGRTYADGKKIFWTDGFEAIVCILKYGLFRSR